jgi:hypothetical protein
MELLATLGVHGLEYDDSEVDSSGVDSQRQLAHTFLASDACVTTPCLAPVGLDELQKR